MDPEQAQKVHEQATAPVAVPIAKYSKTMKFKAIVGRTDGGIGLVGHRVLIGGWVKSSREMKKLPPVLLQQQQQPLDEPSDAVTPKDVSCIQVFHSRIPLFRSIMKVFGGGDYREKLDSPLQKPPPQYSVSILQVSDGSCVPGLHVNRLFCSLLKSIKFSFYLKSEVVIDSSIAPPIRVMPSGTCVLAEGVLQIPGVQGKHVIELIVDKLHHIGTVDLDKYPLSKKRLPLEMLRDYSHFRPRTTTVASITRIHNALYQGTHTFFLNHGFLYVEIPLITSTDGEGFSKKFQVIAHLLDRGVIEGQAPIDDGVRLEDVKASSEEKSKHIEELRRSSSNNEALAAAVHDLKRTNELVSQLEARYKSEHRHALNPGKIEDFFGHQAYLTVSGRLHLESYACALGNVYTFGPRFQASSPPESKRSLAEMWMVEVEMAFNQIEESLDCAVEFLKHLCKWTLDHCPEDLEFMTKRVDKAVVDRLQSVNSTSYAKITYCEAVEVLQQDISKKFEIDVKYGISLTEEHESYLSEEIYKGPVIIFNHPKEVKPFYARLNDDGKTVATFDIIVPKAGNVIRGSQNEERLDCITTRMKSMGLSRREYEWYLDLRKHGAAKSSGFTVCLDRLVLCATGLNDLKDVVPFPRSYGKADN